MGQGNYDHPSYLTRQAFQMAVPAAGAAGTGAHVAFPSAMRLRSAIGTVRVAGTVGTNVSSIIFAGTLALGTITYGTGGVNIGAIGTVSPTDMNATVAAGTVLSVKNGADATATTAVVLEAYLDPAATWTGSNN